MQTLFLDTETTGLNGQRDKIVEIAIVGEQGEVLLNALVNPGIPIPNSHIHGITDAMVRSAPSFETLWPQISELMRGSKVVIYNASFDRKFFPNRLNCAAEIKCAMRAYAEHCGAQRSLIKAAAHIGYAWSGPAHRALGDTLACRAVWNWTNRTSAQSSRQEAVSARAELERTERERQMCVMRQERDRLASVQALERLELAALEASTREDQERKLRTEAMQKNERIEPVQQSKRGAAGFAGGIGILMAAGLGVVVLAIAIGGNKSATRTDNTVSGQTYNSSGNNSAAASPPNVTETPKQAPKSEREIKQEWLKNEGKNTLCRYATLKGNWRMEEYNETKYVSNPSHFGHSNGGHYETQKATRLVVEAEEAKRRGLSLDECVLAGVAPRTAQDFKSSERWKHSLDRVRKLGVAELCTKATNGRAWYAAVETDPSSGKSVARKETGLFADVAMERGLTIQQCDGARNK